MKIKIANFITAFLIYFSIAWLIEIIVGWGSSNPWLIITVWSLAMALADIFIFQPMRNKAKKRKKEKEGKK